MSNLSPRTAAARADRRNREHIDRRNRERTELADRIERSTHRQRIASGVHASTVNPHTFSIAAGARRTINFRKKGTKTKGGMRRKRTQRRKRHN